MLGASIYKSTAVDATISVYPHICFFKDISKYIHKYQESHVYFSKKESCRSVGLQNLLRHALACMTAASCGVVKKKKSHFFLAQEPR